MEFLLVLHDDGTDIVQSLKTVIIHNFHYIFLIIF